MKIDLMKKNLLYVLSINREFATKVSTKRRISPSNIYDGNFCQIAKLKTTIVTKRSIADVQSGPKYTSAILLTNKTCSNST